jgi:hypothetical protein
MDGVVDPIIFKLDGPNTCDSCGKLLEDETSVVGWKASIYCCLPCYQQDKDAWDSREGMDWHAAHDQALAHLNSVCKSRPGQFVLLYGSEEDGESVIASTLFAHPEFVVNCIPALIEGLTRNDPSVAPPPD